MKKTITFYSGFMGTKEDFYPLISHLKGDFNYLFDPEISPENSIVVGYSMGGRKALKTATPGSIVFVLAGHLGLKENFNERRSFEDEWIKELERLPFKSFLEKWYSQDLFQNLLAHPIFPEVFKRRLLFNKEKALRQLMENRLSEQLFSTGNENCFFLYGEKDEKYKILYKTHIPKERYFEIPQAGHALHLENPLETAKIINKILLN